MRSAYAGRIRRETAVLSGPPSSRKSQRPTHPLHSAWIPVIENLESRRLLAVNTVQTLPFELDFSSTVADSLVDKDGQGTGRTRVQANRNIIGCSKRHRSGSLHLDRGLEGEPV